MNGISTTRSGALSGYRSLAHVIAGLEFFAVVALFAWVVVGADVPEWELLLDVVVAAVLVVTAYPVGLVVDGLATKLWRLIGREFSDESNLRQWNAHRTGHPEPEEDIGETATDLGSDPPWWRAQRWLWKSAGARAELGDLRLRLMLGKDTALNALLALGVSVAGLWILPGRAAAAGKLGGVCPGRFAGSLAADMRTLALISGTVLFLALWVVLISPRKGSTRSWNPGDWRFWGRWAGGFLSVAVTAVFVVCFLRLLKAPGLVPSCFTWLVGGTALGPWLVFAFVYVRVDANRLYLGLVREATRIGPPDGDRWPPELEPE